MSTSRVFFGDYQGNRILLTGSGATDAGEAIDVRAEPNAIAPAGAGGEALFVALYFVLSHSMPAEITITPVLDGVALPDCARRITLSAQPQRVTTEHEVPLLRSYLRGGVERSRQYLRGVWLTYQVSTPDGLGAGDLLIAATELEHAVLRKGTNPTPAAA